MRKALSLLRLDFLPKSIDLGLLLLRLWVGLAMLVLHGKTKLLGFSEMSAKFADPFGIGAPASLTLAVFAEVVCSLLLVFGLFTRFAALNLVVTMLVAFFTVHAGALSGPRSGELAFIYLAVYAALFVAGGGRFALDAKFGTKQAGR